MNSPAKWLSGCATALLTPFREDGSVDEDCFVALARRQVENGVRILVPCGTTGESATMSEAERLKVIELTVGVARKTGVKVIAGTGGNNTAATAEFTSLAARAGADMALVVAPYYNKPTQEGLFSHFSAIAEAVPELPLMLYNVPGRTSSNISARTTIRLAGGCPNIVATKEASGDLSQVMEILRDRPEGFRVFSGDDMTALAFAALGAEGVVSVFSNEFPAEMSELVNAAIEGDLETAKRVHYRCLEIMEANFIETSPAPAKYVMSRMGLIENNLRLPLVPVGRETEERLAALLEPVLSGSPS